MKKLFSTRYSAGAFNFAMLILRLTVGILMMLHGYDKLKDFSGTVAQMQGFEFLGLSPKIIVSLLIFAEFFCSILLILGLFTRFACIPLIIAMAVALFKAHGGHIENGGPGGGQMAGLYLLCYIVLLLTGPGKASVDGMISK